MIFKVTVAAAHGKGVAAEVVWSVDVILVPPGLVGREVELELGEGVDVHEGRDGANEGRLHGVGLVRATWVLMSVVHDLCCMVQLNFLVTVVFILKN